LCGGGCGKVAPFSQPFFRSRDCTREAEVWSGETYMLLDRYYHIVISPRLENKKTKKQGILIDYS
jgi:hypothetical protein